MPVRITDQQRKRRYLSGVIESQMSALVLVELQRLWRDLVPGLRRLDRQRGDLHPGIASGLQKDFDPDEKRDESGKWTAGGGGGEAAGAKSKASKYTKIDPKIFKPKEIAGEGHHFINPEDQIFQVDDHDDAAVHLLIDNNQPLKWVGDATNDVIRDGWMRISQGGKSTGITVGKLTTKNWNRLQDLYIAGKIQPGVSCWISDIEGGFISGVTRDDWLHGTGIRETTNGWEVVKFLSPQTLLKEYTIHQSMWDDFRSRMEQRLKPLVEQGIVDLARLNSDYYTQVMGSSVSIDSSTFASRYQAEIGNRIKDIEDSIKRRVGNKVVSWYNQPESTFGDLVTSLAEHFDRSRAEAIGQTEITRLNSGVQKQTAQALGVKEWWWETRRDQTVCVRPINGPDGGRYKGCRALHGKHFTTGHRMPPGHVNCRCSAILVLPSKKPIVKPDLKPIVDIEHLVQLPLPEPPKPVVQVPAAVQTREQIKQIAKE